MTDLGRISAAEVSGQSADLLPAREALARERARFAEPPLSPEWAHVGGADMAPEPEPES